ncbi:MAG: TolB family protein, partial [Phycisphaerales bacterium]
MRRIRGVQGSDLNYPYLGPDNDTLVYTRMINGKASIEVASFDGLFEPRLIVEPVELGFVGPSAIHPSGDRVLVLMEQADGIKNYEIMIDGSGTMKSVADNGSNGGWADYSPDGSMIAYTSDETGRREAYVRSIRPDGSFGRSVPVTNRGVGSVQWQLDPSRRQGAPQPEGESAGDPEGPYILNVFNRTGNDAYPITPGVIPRVGEPTVGIFPQNSELIGAGASLSGNRQLRIVQGEQEKPAEHIELILNWYDEAVKIIKGE